MEIYKIIEILNEWDQDQILNLLNITTDELLDCLHDFIVLNKTTIEDQLSIYTGER